MTSAVTMRDVLAAWAFDPVPLEPDYTTAVRRALGEGVAPWLVAFSFFAADPVGGINNETLIDVLALALADDATPPWALGGLATALAATRRLTPPAP